MWHDCLLCNDVGGELIWQNDLLRIVLVPDKYYPGYLRIITQDHYKELTDLSLTNANQIFTSIFKLEEIIRKNYKPDKVNIASLGNLTPHLHWHIIPRFNNDRHFPNPIWGQITNSTYLPDNISFNTILVNAIEMIKNCFDSSI